MILPLVVLLLQTQSTSDASTSHPPSRPDAAIGMEGGRLPIDLAGHRLQLNARVLRPAGPGPFPLVVINHGTPAEKDKLPGERLGFARAARWFASQGYAVVVAQRPGFGTSDGPYLEAAGSCAEEDYVGGGRSTAAIESAIVRSAQTLPGIDPSRVIVVGQSAGGFGAVALADAPPPGVVAVISFAGGRGGNGREHICAGEDRLVAAERRFGRDNRLPQLWLYAANDHFFRPDLAHRMFAAYSKASQPQVRFVDLPPFDEDGHKTLADADTGVWSDAVSAFLAGVLGRR